MVAIPDVAVTCALLIPTAGPISWVSDVGQAVINLPLNVAEDELLVEAIHALDDLRNRHE